MRISTILGWTIAAALAASGSGCALHAERTDDPGPAPVVAAGTAVPDDTAVPSALPTGCIKAERYDLDLAATDLDGTPAMCFHVGGTLRMQGVGPGELTVEPESLTSVHYEGGVDDVRFDKTGTVTLTFPHGAGQKSITVKVRK